MMPSTDLHDPLGDAADPRGYVPLDTDERALDALLASLLRRSSPILLVGPSGMGKTILLRVLAQRLRLRAHRVVYSPFLHLPSDDVARWLLHLLGKRIGREAPAEEVLLAEVRARRTRATVLLIDELQCTPVESVRLLERVACAGRPALAVVAAGIRGPALDALLPAFAPRTTVSLPDALPREEIEDLCDAVLGSRAVPHALRALALRDRDAITRESRGLPILLKGELVLRAYEVAAGRDGVRRNPPIEPELVAVDSLPVDPAPVERLPLDPPVVDLQLRASPDRACDERQVIPSVPLRARLRAAGGGCVHVLSSARGVAAARSRALREAAAVREARARRFAAACHTKVSNGATELALRLRAHGRAVAAAAARLPAPRSLRVAGPWIAVTAVVLGALLARRDDSARLPPVSAAPVSYTIVSAPEPAPVPAPAPLVRVQVNARPWARVRVDGNDAGSTPLSHLQLPPGPHDFEATFPDGRVVRRRIEIGPERRFVTLP